MYTTISMVYYNLYGLLQSLWLTTISMVYNNLYGLLQSKWFTTISMVYCNLYGFPLLLHQSMNQRMTNLIDSFIGDAKTRKVWQLNLLKTRLKLLSSVDSYRIRHGALKYKERALWVDPSLNKTLFLYHSGFESESWNIECKFYNTFYPFQNKDQIYRHLPTVKILCPSKKLKWKL